MSLKQVARFVSKLPQKKGLSKPGYEPFGKESVKLVHKIASVIRLNEINIKKTCFGLRTISFTGIIFVAEQ
jgi:hypothetical protein